MNVLPAIKYRKLSFDFVVFWSLASIFLIWLLAVGQDSFALDSTWIVVLVLLPCTIILMCLVRNPITDESTGRKTHRGKLFVLIAVVVIALLIVQAVAGKFLLFLLPVVAAAVLWLLKPRLDKREWTYATFLALVAGVTGLGAKWISYITPVQWGFLQVPLTLLSLLAGWSILSRYGSLQQGIGRSRFLIAGRWSAVRSFLLGILLSLPISIICLYHDLEKAIGFHFWMDTLKFTFALFLFNR